MKVVVSALDHHEAIADVYKRVKDAAAFDDHLGPKVKEEQVHIGKPIVTISSLTKTIQPLEFEE